MLGGVSFSPRLRHVVGCTLFSPRVMRALHNRLGFVNGTPVGSPATCKMHFGLFAFPVAASVPCQAIEGKVQAKFLNHKGELVEGTTTTVPPQPSVTRCDQRNTSS